MNLTALQQHDAELLAECRHLIGIDEAGRGALAGPVVAAACVFSHGFFESAEAVTLSAAVNDSKQLSPAARARYLRQMQHLQQQGMLDFTAGISSVPEIAEHNILGATRLAMQRALETLAARATGWKLPCSGLAGPLFTEEPAVRIMVDGRPLKPFPYPHQALVQGDGRSLAIAMASIVAKVTRDRLMLELDARYPDYGFGGHKGYATLHHRRAILACGACPQHRPLFLRKLFKRL